MEPLFSKTQQNRQYRFLLNIAKRDEQELVEIIHELKAKRSFTRAIRTGLRLFWSLRQGRVDILLEEFPWVQEQLQNPIPQLQAQLDRIETKIETVPLQPPQLSATEIPLNHRLNHLETKLLGASNDDLEEDDRLEITIEEAKTEQIIGWNLQLSMAKNGIGCTYMQLPLAALEYGLKRGGVGVTPDIVAQKRALLAQQLEDTSPTIPLHVPTTGARPLDQTNFDISASNWDDLEVEW